MDSDSDEANANQIICHVRFGISGFPLGDWGVFFCAHFPNKPNDRKDF